TDERVTVLRQLVEKAAPCAAAAIFGDAIEARSLRQEAGRKPRIAGHEIDEDIVAPGPAQGYDGPFQQFTGAAFDQKDGADGRMAPAQEIAHSFDYNAQVIRHEPVPAPIAGSRLHTSTAAAKS